MGNSLHNKIYLGRTSALSSKRLQAALVAGTFASMGLVWLAIRLFLK
ncbi:MAG: hypothetical protein V4508_15575 [Pseudomonadota bacterium]